MPTLLHASPERQLELTQPVWVYNLSHMAESKGLKDRHGKPIKAATFRGFFNKARYDLEPKTKQAVPRMMANLWFGDPTLRDEANPKDWRREVNRVKHKHSEEFFENYIETGLVFCWDNGTHEKDFYRMVGGKPDRVIKGVPIGDTELAVGFNLPPMGPVQELSDEEVAAMVGPHVGTKSKKASTFGDQTALNNAVNDANELARISL